MKSMEPFGEPGTALASAFRYDFLGPLESVKSRRLISNFKFLIESSTLGLTDRVVYCIVSNSRLTALHPTSYVHRQLKKTAMPPSVTYLDNVYMQTIHKLIRTPSLLFTIELDSGRHLTRYIKTVAGDFIVRCLRQAQLENRLRTVVGAALVSSKVTHVPKADPK